jgi:D-sedoheptulose 7-phosphate isomerase
MVEKYFNEICDVLDNINKEDIRQVVNLIRNCKGQIFVFGNGGSASTASHFAQDMNKQLNYRFLCLNDNIPSILAYANDEGYNTIFISQLKRLLNSEDIVIGISCSGNSRNVIDAIIYANVFGCKTIGFTGFDCGQIKNCVDYNICIPSDDMQICEDIHLIIIHLILKLLK